MAAYQMMFPTFITSRDCQAS